MPPSAFLTYLATFRTACLGWPYHTSSLWSMYMHLAIDGLVLPSNHKYVLIFAVQAKHVPYVYIHVMTELFYSRKSFQISKIIKKKVKQEFKTRVQGRKVSFKNSVSELAVQNQTTVHMLYSTGGCSK